MSSRIVHGVNLSEDVVRIRVDYAIEKYAPLVCPVDDEITQHVLGTYVVWLRQLVDLILDTVEGTSQSSGQSKAKKLQKSPSPKPEQDTGERLSNLRVLLSTNATQPDNVYQIDMPEEVVGHSHSTFIHSKDIEDLLNKNQLDLCWLQLWIIHHWTLAVICPLKGLVFWYDSLGGLPSKDIKELFKSVLDNQTIGSVGIM